jgi:imidazolonepropionase-like amidohydrolase
VGDQLGTVEAGKIADLIAVAANPLDDINNLRQLQLVIKNGRVVSDKRETAVS